jgi:hypothetical protein
VLRVAGRAEHVLQLFLNALPGWPRFPSYQYPSYRCPSYHCECPSYHCARSFLVGPSGQSYHCECPSIVAHIAFRLPGYPSHCCACSFDVSVCLSRWAGSGYPASVGAGEGQDFRGPSAHDGIWVMDIYTGGSRCDQRRHKPTKRLPAFVPVAFLMIMNARLVGKHAALAICR